MKMIKLISKFLFYFKIILRLLNESLSRKFQTHNVSLKLSRNFFINLVYIIIVLENIYWADSKIIK